MNLEGLLRVRKKIQLGLLILLVLVSAGLLFRYKFSANTMAANQITGILITETEGTAISGAKVTFSPDPPLESAPDWVGEATTDTNGRYIINTASSVRNGYLSMAKDGFYDLEGYINFDPYHPNIQTQYINLAMKEGFGKEAFISKRLYKKSGTKSGFTGLSLPFIPYSKQPDLVFTNLNVQGYGAEGTDYVSIFNYNPNIACTASTGYNNPNIKLYYQNNQGTLANLTDVSTPFEELKPATGFYLQNDGCMDYQLTIKGTVSNQELLKSLNNTGRKTALGNPYLAEVSTAELSILDGTSFYSLSDAITNGLIEKNLERRIGTPPNALDQTPINIVDQPYLSSVMDTVLLTAKKDGLKIKYNTENPDLIEIPQDISHEDAEWAFWVDQDTLSDEDYAIWENVYEKITQQALIFENKEALDIENGEFVDSTPSFTKNGKIIPESQDYISPTPVLPPVPTLSDNNSGIRLVADSNLSQQKIILAANPPTRFDSNRCIHFDVKIDLCTKDFNPSYRVIKWNLDASNNLLNYLTGVGDFMVNTYGNPLNQNSGKTRYIYLFNDKDGPFGLSLTKGIYLNMYYYPKINDPINGLDDNAKTTIIHETFHQFRGAYSLRNYCLPPKSGVDKCRYISWEEGMVVLAAYETVKYGSLNNKVAEALVYAHQMSQPQISTNTATGWSITAGMSKFLRRYSQAAAAWSQQKAVQPDYLKKFNHILSISPLPDRTTKTSQIPQEIFTRFSGLLLGAEMADDWYTRQWGGLIQVAPYLNQKKEPYRGNIAYAIRNGIINNMSESLGFFYREGVGKGNIFPRAAKVKVTLTKDLTMDGKPQHLPVYTEKVQTKSNANALTKVIPGTDLVPGRRYIYFNTFTYSFPSGLLGRNITTYTYHKALHTAIPNEDAGIYGVVAGVHNNAWVTVVNLQTKEEKVYTIHDGYFQTGNTEAGSFVIRTFNRPDVAFTKPAGKYFVPIDSGTTKGSLLQSKNDDLLKNFAGIFSAIAEDQVESITIDGIKTTQQADNSIKISFQTSREAGTYIEWGPDENYGQETDMNATDTNHEIILKPVIPGQTYHYIIRAIDANGYMALDTPGETMEEQSGGWTDSTDSGDKTFTPIEIKNIISSNIKEVSAQISWDTVPNTKGTIEYGETASYGQRAEAIALQPNQLLTLTGLTANTVYHYRIRAYLDDGSEAFSEDRTFTTLAPDPLVITPGAGNWIWYWRTPTSGRSFWTTNKPAICTVTYRPYSSKNTDNSYNFIGSEITTGTTLSGTNHSVKLDNLLPLRGYLANINCSGTGTSRTANLQYWPAGVLNGNFQININDTTYAPNILISWQSNGPWPDNYPNPTETYSNPANPITDGYLEYTSNSNGIKQNLDFPGPGNPTSLLITGLTPGTGYPFKIYNDKFTYPKSLYSGYLNPKSPPNQILSNTINVPLLSENGLTVLGTSLNESPSITLDWETLKQDNTSGYNIYRAEGTGEITLLAQISGAETFFQDNKLKKDTIYKYVIKSQKDGQELSEISKATVMISGEKQSQKPGFFGNIWNHIKSAFNKLIDIFKISTP